ncbi:hypothetical protein NDU88_000995 [Pleurodeles waltl]|uniref:Uncharacterized protein n=1 Tax=Pleurodeles waltl TaxID=8319 RepID=A0AAV7S8V0_PLEWA|nr:hypothetical protein NDU88_000995 [Pleurodeles waltl]
MADKCVRRAWALLVMAGRMYLVKEEALCPLRPARKAASGVAAAVIACSPPRSGRRQAKMRVGGRAQGGLWEEAMELVWPMG